jgi:phage terminase small subunit
MPRELTAKQNKFKDSIIKGMNQTDAYRSAYNCENMKSETIINKAYILANRGDIRAIIEQGRKELENAEIWTRKQALEELSNIGAADIKKYLEYKTEKTVVEHDTITGKPIIDYKQIVDVMDSAKVDGRVIQEVSISRDGTFKFKLYDKLKAIELANKMCGYNEPDKMELSGMNIKIELVDD